MGWDPERNLEDRCAELQSELDRLRAENERLKKLNKANSDGWAECVKLNERALTPIEADRLRAENERLRHAVEVLGGSPNDVANIGLQSFSELESE